MATPTRAEVCCDPSCGNYNVQQIIPLTAEEIAQIETDAAAAAEAQAEAEAQAAAVATAKANAEAKLAALGLSADEIAALSK